MNHLNQFLDAMPADAALVHRPENMHWLAGYTGEGCLFISGTARIILTDFRYVEAAQKQCPAFEIHSIRAGVGHVKLAGELLEKHGINKLLYEDNIVTVRAMRDMEKAMPENMTFEPLNFAVEALRTVKDEEELKAIQHACDITCQAFEYICGYIKPGMTERQVQLALDYKMLELGAQDMAFSTIVASGENGSLPHAVPGERVIQKGDFVTMDYGAKVDGYCSDMTRTVAVGEPSQKLREIYEIVLRAQEAAQAALAPGKNCADMDKIARDIIAAAGYGECFGHSLGHGVGIDIHEEPRLSSRSTDILAPGHIVTVEPGIYVPGLGGVRIENTCVITEDGYKALCSASKDLRIL